MASDMVVAAVRTAGSSVTSPVVSMTHSAIACAIHPAELSTCSQTVSWRQLLRCPTPPIVAVRRADDIRNDM
ncbi:hypothetical protein JCM9533A_31020 [Catenuloplanes niger JCM 9533]